MMTFSHYDKDRFMSQIRQAINNNMFPIIKSNKKQKYINIGIGLDTETTSLKQNDIKYCCLYTWQLTIYGVNTYIGRTCESLVECLDILSEELQLITSEVKMLIYVHNLAFEFQFLRKYLDVKKVFAIDDRKPVKVELNNNIEFRCSYILTGMPLEMVAEKIKKHTIKKAVGDLDYQKLRHSETELLPEEYVYCVTDTLIIAYYIQEQIEIEQGNISNIPLTKTSYVRRYCKKKCNADYYNYRRLMNNLTLTANEYKYVKKAFQGGFTHANPYRAGSNRIHNDVRSFDFTSSYPAVMICEKFPMSKPITYKPINMEDFKRQIKLYNCIFTVRYTNIRIKQGMDFENPISFSKCYDITGYTLNNGRVVDAGTLTTTITEQDYIIYNEFYEWDKIEISHFIKFQKAYLPTALIGSVLELYKDKTELKGVSGKEYEYTLKKEMLNSCYGMCVTDIIKDELIYINDEWDVIPADTEELIKKYNTSRSRFLYYVWGIFITAYARKNLFTAITECKYDYIYSDTDSVKIINAERHLDYFEHYNNTVVKKLKNACKHHNISYDYVQPNTINGVKKIIGVWDDDGIYDEFKTLGAKRYVVRENDRIKTTVAGVNKKNCANYLTLINPDNPINAFNDELHIPAEYTGKLTHTYIDDTMKFYMVDYNGVGRECVQLSGVHLEPTSYDMSMPIIYINYLLGCQINERNG